MDSTISWVQIARSDVAKATDLLRGGERGVRDEVGFLALHQGFSNRFFPGTSVLQTRLRYALFVPWIFRDLWEQEQRANSSPNSRLAHRERDLVIRLKQGAAAASDDDRGIIGIRSHDFRPAQPPSFVYWSALRIWGILQQSGQDRWPTRAEILAGLGAMDSFRRDHYDEGRSIEPSLFFALPDPPPGWEERGAMSPLNFKLRRSEQKYLKDRLGDVRRNGGEDHDSRTDSLLARLARTNRPKLSWKIINYDAPQVMEIADLEDRKALVIARRASSLARIGRAAYAALIEYSSERFDRRKVGNASRKALEQVRAEELKIAAQFNLAEVESAIGVLDKNFHTALSATVKWLKSGRNDVDELWEPYRVSEEVRKGPRARLPNTLPAGKLRRIWLGNPQPPAEMLNYRWHRVSQMLDDLHGVHD